MNITELVQELVLGIDFMFRHWKIKTQWSVTNLDAKFGIKIGGNRGANTEIFELNST